MMECKSSSESPSSSMDSSGRPAASTASSVCRPARRDLSTDLQLGLSMFSSSFHADSTPSIPSTREQQVSDWPPIKTFLRSTLTTTAMTAAAATADQKGGGGGERQRTLFVKVYMEGIPIGRKLDLLLLDGYHSLLTQLCCMFKTPITCPDVMDHQVVFGKKADHVLTYEDQEGDWMMVGDVPWELFLTSVKKLRIARADNC